MDEGGRSRGDSGGLGHHIIDLRLVGGSGLPQKWICSPEAQLTEVKIRLLRPEARVPERMSQGASGYDLFASEDSVVPAATVSANGRVDIGRSLIPLGMAIELPIETVGRIASRSGLSVISNVEAGAGWIDSDFRGEVMVELKNFSSVDFEVRQGDRIAQLILLPVTLAEFIVEEGLGDTGRGQSGFGSTGV